MSHHANTRSGRDRRRTMRTADTRPADDAASEWPPIVRPFERRGLSRDVVYRSGADRRDARGID